MNKLKPIWKNTLNVDVTFVKFLSDLIAFAASLGYPYVLWRDNQVYTYSYDKHNMLVTEPTEFTIEDLES